MVNADGYLVPAPTYPPEDGAVYTWGRGDDGRLGHGDNGWKYVPRVVEALEGQRIVQVGKIRSLQVREDMFGSYLVHIWFIFVSFSRGLQAELNRWQLVTVLSCCYFWFTSNAAYPVLLYQHLRTFLEPRSSSFIFQFVPRSGDGDADGVSRTATKVLVVLARRPLNGLTPPRAVLVVPCLLSAGEVLNPARLAWVPDMNPRSDLALHVYFCVPPCLLRDRRRAEVTTLPP